MELTKSKWLYPKEHMILSTNKTTKFEIMANHLHQKKQKNTIILLRMEKKMGGQNEILLRRGFETKLTV